MWFLTITSIRIPSSEPFITFINITVLRLRSTDWKSSLITALGAYNSKNGMVKFFILSTFDQHDKVQFLAKFKNIL